MLNVIKSTCKVLGLSTVVAASSVTGCLVGAAMALVASEDLLNRRYGNEN